MARLNSAMARLNSAMARLNSAMARLNSAMNVGPSALARDARAGTAT